MLLIDTFLPILTILQGARLREKQDKSIAGEEESDSEDEDIEEELGYISALDTVDPYVSFKQALTSMSIYLISLP